MKNLYSEGFQDSLQKTLRNVRLACGFSQNEVAEVLKISRSTYTYYENGKIIPDVQALRILAELYGIPAVVFMFPEEYADMEASRLKSHAPIHSLPDPRRFGELTQEEKDVVKAYRLKKRAAPMGKSNHLEDLEITVMKTTAQDLRRISEETGLAIGEAVDRLAERMAATDPEIAKILIHEDLVIIPVKLSREQREDVFKEIAKSLLMTFDPDTMDDLVEQAKEEQQEGLEKLSSMSDGDLFQMLDSYREMTEFDN